MNTVYFVTLFNFIKITLVFFSGYITPLNWD